jgi:hypothetical protein
VVAAGHRFGHQYSPSSSPFQPFSILAECYVRRER